MGLVGKPRVGLAYEVSNDTSNVRRLMKDEQEYLHTRCRPPRKFTGPCVTPNGESKYVRDPLLVRVHRG